MKAIEIKLYKFNELSEEAKEKAIDEHKVFLDSILFDFQDEEGEMQEEYIDHTEEQVIESIEINEYLFFSDGKLANTTTYTGKHEKAGTTELKIGNDIYVIN